MDDAAVLFLLLFLPFFFSLPVLCTISSLSSRRRRRVVFIVSRFVSSKKSARTKTPQKIIRHIENHVIYSSFVVVFQSVVVVEALL